MLAVEIVVAVMADIDGRQGLHLSDIETDVLVEMKNELADVVETILEREDL